MGIRSKNLLLLWNQRRAESALVRANNPGLGAERAARHSERERGGRRAERGRGEGGAPKGGSPCSNGVGDWRYLTLHLCIFCRSVCTTAINIAGRNRNRRVGLVTLPGRSNNIISSTGAAPRRAEPHLSSKSQFICFKRTCCRYDSTPLVFMCALAMPPLWPTADRFCARNFYIFFFFKYFSF